MSLRCICRESAVKRGCKQEVREAGMVDRRIGIDGYYAVWLSVLSGGCRDLCMEV